jgi:Skp family chaperone for outer membrane proteins
MKADIEAKKFVLSDESLRQKQYDLLELQNQLENKGKELENQFKIDAKRVQEPLINKLRQIITETGREQGFTLILQRGGAGLIYTREALDITDLIIAQYNKK